MPYNIKDIRYAKAENKLYLVDTNVWLADIASFDFNRVDRFRAYLAFFEKLKSAQTTPQNRIILCALQVSEILNSYLKKIAMAQYAREQNVEEIADYFKSIYRNTDDFRNHHKLIQDEFKSYRKIIQPVDDCFQVLWGDSHFDTFTTSHDYNDYYYYKLCTELQNKRGVQVAIVTHDSDFKFEGIEVITDNQKLKDLR